MTTPNALVLVVFGRGVRHTGGRYALTPASAARVRAATEHVAAHEAAFTHVAAQHRPGLVIFTGGWAEACEGAPQPPTGSCEGDLMLAQARAAGLDRLVELHLETRSRSTLENLLHIVEDGLLEGHDFTVRHPLGLVSHPWHLPRVRFLAGKVLGLHGATLLDVPTTGGELPTWHSGRASLLASRLTFLGARDAATLRRRERRTVAALRRVERLTGFALRQTAPDSGNDHTALPANTGKNIP